MIPLSIPNLNGNEWAYIKDCLDTNWISSVGSYVNKFEDNFSNFTQSKFAIATSNGTAALHISLLLAGVCKNDLVILPNVTFVASANAIKYTGADPILIDIDPDNWQINLDLLEELLLNNCHLVDNRCIHTDTNRTIKAIMPVHILGNMCDMDKLMKIAAKYNLTVVEDSTEALGSTFNGKHAGTFGLFGTSSFNGNKIITTGGGGMIMTDNEELAIKAKHLTTQAKADKFEYFHDEIGYNYRLVNILAAMGVAQLEQLNTFIARKKQIAAIYDHELSKIPDIQKQVITNGVTPNHWLFTVKLPNQRALIEVLKQNHIEARPFWVPMNALPAMKNDLYISEFQHSKNLYETGLSLPSATQLTDEEILKVCKTIISFYEK